MGAPVMDGTQAAVSDKAAGVSVDMKKPMLKQVVEHCAQIVTTVFRAYSARGPYGF